MEKFMTTLISILFCTLLSAPPNNSGMVFESEGINYYEPLIKAVVMVESSNGKYTYNPDEGAVGWFQIRQVRVDHYNQMRGTNYKLTDFYDYDLSREMFLWYASGKSYEVAARNWNGKWVLTEKYWKRVKQHLN
jgi:hypothetical protein